MTPIRTLPRIIEWRGYLVAIGENIVVLRKGKPPLRMINGGKLERVA